MVAVGTIVWLSSELMFFAALFAMYFTLRAAVPEVWAQDAAVLNFPMALINSTILVLSSVTCQLGVNKVEAHGKPAQPRRTGSIMDIKNWGMAEWFILSFLMGAVFVAVQAFEYTELIHEGISLSSSAFGSVFFLTTGFHGLHVIGGLVAFLLIVARAYMARNFGAHEATSAVVVSYYWHFVDVVWVALFIIIYVIK
ncbi:heme-copper oxidase subunit III [Galactobacter caseinivorans]|uniref:cytochrome-c oxidase n=2 Tax=Galactobacter caseinivorans TaxID=2676123 RepID=A0A496PKX4_9MICC|nr:heme-copper oxidase subunit III [Galactobacter caseinivorans]RKW71138.1 heme-copper oxidase subunit III [Galactobacter caseinivorans]